MPDKYDWIKNFKVKDAILAAGGLTKDAYLEKAEILRVDKNRQYQTIYFNVSKAMLENEQDNILLQDEDKITIHSVNELAYKKTVSIEGDVLRPGTYQLTEQMTVKELVFAAGNVLESAYLDDAEIASMEVENGNATKIVQRNINLKKALEGDEIYNVKLKPYDRVFVKKILDWRREHFVTVTGQFKFPGRYIIRKGEKLSSLIQRAGGYTDNAYLRGAVFIRERVKEMQQKGIEEMASRLEKELLSQSSEQISTAVSNEEIQGKQYEVAQKKKLIENMRNLKALGRMTIKLAHVRLLKGSEYDIELEDGDSLFIPEKNSVVTVTGAVMAQGSYVFSEKADYLDYINMSGGYSDYADKSKVFVLKVDGSAHKAHRSLINWNEKKDRLEMAAFSDEETNYIEPGDVVVVPEKIDRIAWLREIRDISQILMNTAVVAGVVKVLF
jgi:protein involved in polysaccharide export with SLBB domain